jgi:DNA-binding transcriptional LysR family regulator
MNLSTKQLRAFLALRDVRNFTQAAERCHLSQSAFSALIGNLERDAGVRLFDRSTRRVELTPEGEAFAESAALLIADFDKICEDLRDRVDVRGGRVSIAALPSIAAGLLPELLQDFHERHPGVQLDLFDVLSDECIALVRRGRADFAIAALGPDMTGLDATPFCTDSYYLVCHREHPLAAKRTIRPEHLAQYPFINLARNTSIRQQLDMALQPLRLRGVMEVEQLATAAALVVHQLGFTVIPELALFPFRHEALAIKPLRLDGLVRHLYVIRLQNRSLSIAADAFLQQVLQARRA